MDDDGGLVKFVCRTGSLRSLAVELLLRQDLLPPVTHDIHHLHGAQVEPEATGCYGRADREEISSSVSAR